MQWLAGLSLVVLLTGASAAAQVPPPDPMQGDGRVSTFYRWLDNIPESPGRMLRSEPLEPGLGITNVGRQLRLLYSSTDGVDGKTPTVVSAAYYEPKGEPPPNGWPLLAWAHGTTGVADICAPSVQARVMFEITYLNTWLEQGFAIVATDYQGLGTPGPHPYMQGRPAAYSVLDSLRAVLQDQPRLANRIVLAGFSQGAHAAFSTAGYAPIYATDLNIRAVIGIGIPYPTREFLSRPLAEVIGPEDRPDPTVAYNLYLALVMQQRNPNFIAGQVLTGRGLPFLDLARASCVGALFYDATSAGLNRANTLEVINYRDEYLKILPGMEYPTMRLTVPLFVGAGENDRDVPLTRQLSLVKNACEAGTVVEAHVYRGLSHVQSVDASLKDAIPFARKALAGESITAICEPVTE
jgi:pimeloyl-ACP methyl ester carboxylesterase